MKYIAKIIVQILILTMLIILSACANRNSGADSSNATVLYYLAEGETPDSVTEDGSLEDEPEPPDEPVSIPPTLPGRIAIITEDGGGWHSEQYLSAVSLVKSHGAENIVHFAGLLWRYADRHCDLRLTEFVRRIAEDFEIRVLIVNPVCYNTDRMVSILRELRSDIFIIYIEHPTRFIGHDAFSNSAYLADLVLNANTREVSRATPMQARRLGADTLIFFGTYPGDLIDADAILEKRRMWRTESEKAGLNFVEVFSRYYESPQCGSHLAHYISERVLPAIEEYGNNTVLVGICAERLFWTFLSHGTIYPAPLSDFFLPSPHFIANNIHWLMPASEELSREEFFAKENLTRIIQETREVLEEKGLLGRVSTWPVSTRSMFAYAAVEYGIMWMNGEVPQEDICIRALEQIMVDFIAQYAGKKDWGVAITPFSHDGIVHSNFLLVFLDFMIY